MKRKLLIAVTLIVLLLMVFSGCSRNAGDKNPGPDPSTPPEITDNNNGQTDGQTPDPAGDENNNSDPGDAADTKTDSGRYVGRADSNFIEINISGVPEEMAAKVFMLSDELKENFEDLGFETGDNVKFNYYVNDNGQNVITSIEKI